MLGLIKTRKLKKKKIYIYIYISVISLKQNNCIDSKKKLKNNKRK